MDLDYLLGMVYDLILSVATKRSDTVTAKQIRRAYKKLTKTDIPIDLYETQIFPNLYDCLTKIAERVSQKRVDNDALSLLSQIIVYNLDNSNDEALLSGLMPDDWTDEATRELEDALDFSDE